MKEMIRSELMQEIGEICGATFAYQDIILDNNRKRNNISLFDIMKDYRFICNCAVRSRTC
jgi:hypothetical protein